MVFMDGVKAFILGRPIIGKEKVYPQAVRNTKFLQASLEKIFRKI